MKVVPSIILLKHRFSEYLFFKLFSKNQFSTAESMSGNKKLKENLFYFVLFLRNVPQQTIHKSFSFQKKLPSRPTYCSKNTDGKIMQLFLRSQTLIDSPCPNLMLQMQQKMYFLAFSQKKRILEQFFLSFFLEKFNLAKK